MEYKKSYRFGNGDSTIINDVGLKNKIIDFIFNSYDLSKYRYNMLTSLQKLEFLKENEHYVTPNFYGYNYLLIFMTINDNKYCVAVEKKGLSYHRNQIDVSRINMYKLLVHANQAIFRGTVFDTKLISISKDDKKSSDENLAITSSNKNLSKPDNRFYKVKYYMLIKDCYYLMGNQFLDLEMKSKMNHIDNLIKTQFGERPSKNFVFKINKLSSYSELSNLIKKVIPNCSIKCQGLIFYPKYSGINIVYLDKQQEKIEISSNNNKEIESKSLDLITNMVEYLKARTYSYEKGGKSKKLWLKVTEIPDVYDIFEKNSVDSKLGIAHVPNLRISHMCKENINSSLKSFECVYDKNFKKWIPINVSN